MFAFYRIGSAFKLYGSAFRVDNVYRYRNIFTLGYVIFYAVIRHNDYVADFRLFRAFARPFYYGVFAVERVYDYRKRLGFSDPVYLFDFILDLYLEM